MHFNENDCSLTQTLNDMIVAQKTIEQEIVVVDVIVSFKSKTKIKQVVIETKKVTIVVQKTIEQKVVVVFKSQSKIKLNKSFKSFKFEKFAINFNSNSTSMILCFESIIKSNVVFVANSIFISTSKSSNSISLRSILSCSTSTILLINQSSYLLVANQLVVEKVVKQIVIETIKSEIINLKNINFFDFTMQVNL